MYYTVLSVLLLLSISSFAYGSQCTDDCNRNYGYGNPVTFCSTQGETFSTRVSALYSINGFYTNCYGQCGVAILHVGACGCANDCFNTTSQGTCTIVNNKNKCQCAPGWGGDDCSQVKCPSSCSGHGKCTTQTTAKGGDICECQPGWTSNDCSVKVPQYFIDRPFGDLPFGQLPNGSAYFQKDKFNDVHPFFNHTVIATVKITISEANLQYMLNPSTIYEVDYVDAKLYFYNGILSKASDVTFRVKGLSSRLMAKKSWNVKFPKGDAYRDLKGFSLKSNIGDRQSSSQLMWDIYRAQKVQTYRHGHAQLYINNIFYGLVSLEERIDDNWMESRYNINEKNEANLYKLSPYSLQYVGDTIDDYKNFAVKIFNDKMFNGIEQEEGNGDWNDIVGLITAVNSSQSIATDYLQENFNLAGLAKAWALETAFRNSDASLGTGNNWYLVDTKEGPQINWEFIGFDFDTAITTMEPAIAAFLGMTTEQLIAFLDNGGKYLGGFDVSSLIMVRNPYTALLSNKKPLALAAIKVPGFNSTFTAMLKQFVNEIIVKSPGRAQQIHNAHIELVRPILATDRMYTISNTPMGFSLATFDQAARETQAWLNERWAYLASMFKADGHGACDSNGVCQCFDGYFGDSCENFCGVDFVQTKTNSWNDGTSDFSQWQVNLYVGSTALKQAVIEAKFANGVSFNPWNLVKSNSGSNLYTLPNWQYQNGAIAANSNHVSFGYTTSSMNATKFRLNNNACAPTTCPLAVSTNVKSSWVNGNTYYQQVEFNVQNPTTSEASNVQIKLSFSNGAYVSQSWNIAPSTSSPSAASETFSCSLYNLSPGQTSTQCGFVLASSSSSTSFTSAFVSATCL